MGIENKRLHLAIGLAMEKFCHGKDSREDCRWVTDVSSWPSFESPEDTVTIAFKNRDDRQFFLDCKEFEGKYACDMRVVHKPSFGSNLYKFLLGSGGFMFGCTGLPPSGNDISFDAYDGYVEMDTPTDQITPPDTYDAQELPRRPDTEPDTPRTDIPPDDADDVGDVGDIEDVDDMGDISELDMNIPPDNCDIENPSEVEAEAEVGRPDMDGDGVIDEEDNCPEDYNPDQIDSDNDGVGDACDDCPTDPDKIHPGVCGCGVPDKDTDEDGIEDCLDNCPDMANPAQKDSNEDGIGDLCDPSMKEVFSGIFTADMDLYNGELILYGMTPVGKPSLVECQATSSALTCSAGIEIPVAQIPVVAQSYVPRDHGGLALAMGVGETPTVMGRFDRVQNPPVQSYQFSSAHIVEDSFFYPTYPIGFIDSPTLSESTIFISHFYCPPDPEDLCSSPSLLVGYRDHPDWSQKQFKMTHLIPETFDRIPDVDLMNVTRRSVAMARTNIDSDGCKRYSPCNLLLVMSAGDQGHMAGIGLHPGNESSMMMSAWIGFSGPAGDVEAHHIPELNLMNSGTIAVVPMAKPHHSLKFVDVTSVSADQHDISLEDAIPAEAKITDISFDQAAAEDTTQQSLHIYLAAGERIVRVNVDKNTFTSQGMECVKVSYGAANIVASASWLFVGTTDGRVLRLDLSDPDLFGSCQLKFQNRM